MTQPPINKGLFFNHGDHWKRIRTIITPTFSTGKLKGVRSHEIIYCYVILFNFISFINRKYYLRVVTKCKVFMALQMNPDINRYSENLADKMEKLAKSKEKVEIKR